MNSRNTLAGWLALLLLPGCGGGDSSTPIPPANAAPVLTTVNFTLDEDTTLTAQLAATDQEGQAVTFSKSSDPAQGTATVTASGTLTYVPVPDFAGSVSLGVTVVDSAGAQATATVSLVVRQVNDPPVLVSRRFDFDEDSLLTAQLVATDAEGQPVTFAKSADPVQGTVTLSSSGSLTYLPSADFAGTDLLGVVLTDADGARTTATISLVVRPVNDVPTLAVAAFTLDEDTSLSTQLVGMDPEGQSVSFAKTGDPAQGTATVSASGALTYVPPQNFNGTVQLGVTLSDSLGAQAIRTIALTVRPVNDAPVARDDELRVPTGAPVTLSLLANDTDVDGDQLNVTVTSQARGGTVSVGAGNVVTLTPDASYSGPMSFTYRVADAAGVTADATVRMVVGNFAGIVYISDEVTPGTYDLMYYDGFRAARLNAPLEAGFVLKRFALSADGRKVAYVANGPGFDRVFVVSLSSPGSVQSIHTTTPASPNTYADTQVQLNRDGTLALVFDGQAPLASRWWLVSTSGTGSPRRIGANNPEIVEFLSSGVRFGGGSDIWVTARINGVSLPGSNTGSFTVYLGSTASPESLLQVGGAYSAASGGIAGFLSRVTPDGQNLVHIAIQYGPSSTTADLLTIDRSSRLETYLYRKFAAFEFPAPQDFDVNNGGDAVCFRVNQTGVSSSIGPGRFYVANPKAPGSAVPVTPLADFNMSCQWASDGRRMAYSSGTSTPGGIQWWVVDRLSPLAAAVLNAPIAAGEQVGGTLARKRPIGIYVLYPPAGLVRSLHRVSLDSPGQATTFFSAWQPGYPFDTQNLTLNPEGTMLAYRKDTVRPRLYIVSTETAEYEIPLTRSDALLGVLQAEWVPEP